MCMCARVCVCGHACACTLVCLCKVLRNTVDTGQGHRLCFGQGRRIFSGVPKLQDMQSVAVMETIILGGGGGAQARRSTELMWAGDTDAVMRLSPLLGRNSGALVLKPSSSSALPPPPPHTHTPPRPPCHYCCLDYGDLGSTAMLLLLLLLSGIHCVDELCGW